MKLSYILESIDLGTIALPEFQRGYVWSREQVRGLMQSLYQRYPVGGLLLWQTRVGTTATRGSSALKGGTVTLLLDGQQRITSLYGIARGCPPEFFDGNPDVFTGLHFNVEEETFEFYRPSKMSGNPVWVDVTKLMQSDAYTSVEQLEGRPQPMRLRNGSFGSRACWTPSSQSSRSPERTRPSMSSSTSSTA